MNQIVAGLIVLVVGFAGGFFFSNSNSSDHHALSHEEGGEHTMHHETLVEVPAGSPVPSVSLEVLPDPKSGWNAHIVTNNFRFAPERVSTEHVFGEGHAHIYVDGVKINRVYGNWYHLGVLSEGSHEVRVDLNANDHNPYAVNGVKIDDTVTVVVEPKKTFDVTQAKMHSVSIVERVLSPQTITVVEGESVHLKIMTDESGEFHIAGYEIEKEMNTSGITDLMFVADQAGRYALELHPEGDGHMDGNHSTMEKEDIEIGFLVVNPR